jgi:hypothetical protein
MAGLVFGIILIVAGAAVAALEVMWRARERRDGVR